MSKTPYEAYGDESPPGWKSLVQPLIELCEANNVEIMQIKSKFGGLRFYVGEAPLEVLRQIADAEQNSLTVCEECGESPAVNQYGLNGSWISTLCEKHWRERDEASR